MASQPSHRRRFQFRLRTLMIGVTLLAVACWVAVDRALLIRERDDALLRALDAEGEAKVRLKILEEYRQGLWSSLERIKGLEEKIQARSSDGQDRP
jgi:hypothetical protein